MKKRILKVVLWMIAVFVVLFVIRLIYGYVVYPNGPIERQEESYSSSFSFETRNIATEKYKSKAKYDKGYSQSATETSTAVDQKYEMVSTMTSKSDSFQKDENKIRNLVKKYNALIQFEQNSGNPGKRRLKLAIGVNPDKFDQMLLEIKKVGRITGFQVDKKDKTNEYRELNAKKKTLEKTRESLIGLKERGGSIEELIALEDRILEIERMLQNLGVNLGDFDAENEFCTIKFSLIETNVNIRTISLMKRTLVALDWTLRYFAAILGVLLLVLLSGFVLITIYDKVKDQFIPNKKEE